MINEHSNVVTNHTCHMKWISWSAIMVGALVSIGVSFLLNLFTIAINLSLVTTTSEGLTTLAVGGFVGLLIGAVVTMFSAGYTAGYLGRPFSRRCNLGVLYGFVTWCVALILMILLVSYVGRYVTYYSNFITHPTIITLTEEQQASPLAITDEHVGHTDVAVNPQAAANNLGYSAFVLFVLFFVGALSSCFGGHYGMKSKMHEDELVV